MKAITNGWEVYDAEGNELTYDKLDKEAAEFWGHPYEGEYDWKSPARPEKDDEPFFSDLYFSVIKPMKCLDEGLIEWRELVGKMIAFESNAIKINPRSYHTLIDKLAPYIKLIRHWEDKGYKAYSARYDSDEDVTENTIACRKKIWEECCPPSYRKFGDIQQFNPLLK